MSELDQLRQAIAALEKQRATLGDAIVDAALAPMREKLAALVAQEAAPDPQLKYITVLFTDIAGSTRLTQGMDPEDISTLMDGVLRVLSEPIEKHGGRIIRYMGDGFAAVFGVDVAHEDDAERAVRAGLDLIEAAKVLAVRIENEWSRSGFNIRVGINSGPVAIGGFSEAGDTLAGLTINLAARMESSAPIGSVQISHHTYQHVQNLFEVQPLPPVNAKGFAEPVPVYVVQRARPRTFLTPKRGVQGTQTRMVGRAAELEQLHAIFQTVQQSAQTQVVTIRGDPGVGKSRLLYEFEQWITHSGEKVNSFKGRATSTMSGTPYALLRDIFGETFGILDNDPTPLMRQKLEAGLTQWFETEPTMKAHFIGALLGFDFADSPHLLGVQGDPQQLRDRALFYLEQLLAALAQQAITLVLLEDIHWSDRSSLDAIMHIVRRSPPARLMIVGLARPAVDEQHPAWSREQTERPAVYHTIDLQPLSIDASQQLVQEILRKLDAPPSELRELIVRTAEGNPFYVEELIENLIDDGVIQIDHDADVWRIDHRRLPNLRVPPTLTALLQARLESLSPTEKLALQQGAAAGRIFWDALVQALQGGVQPPVTELAGLAQRQLVVKNESSAFAPTREYIFQHALLRDVVYDTVLKRTRQVYHAGIADWLIEVTRAHGRAEEYAAVIAEHYALANKVEAAAAWYQQAGERAKAQGAFVEARKFLERTLELLPPVDRERRWRALLEHDEVTGILGDTEARLTTDRALLALAHDIGDDNYLAEAHYRAGTYPGVLGDHVAELKSYDAALAHARRAGNRTLEALVLGVKIVCLTRLSELTAAAAAAEEALAIAHDLNDEAKLSRVLTNVAVYCMEIGDSARATQLIQQSVEINHRLGNRFGEALGLLNLGYNLLMMGLFEQGQTMLEQAQQLTEAIGARRESAFGRLNLGLVYWRDHNNLKAQHALEQGMRELATIGDRFGQATGLSYLGLAFEQAGEADQAKQHFAEAQAIFNQIGARSFALDALAGLARNSPLNEARQHVDALWIDLQQHSSRGMEFPARAYLICAEIFSSTGEADQASLAIETGYRELIERAEKISDRASRQSFLENIPEHRTLLELWKRVTV